MLIFIGLNTWFIVSSKHLEGKLYSALITRYVIIWFNKYSIQYLSLNGSICRSILTSESKDTSFNLRRFIFIVRGLKTLFYVSLMQPETSKFSFLSVIRPLKFLLSALVGFLVGFIWWTRDFTVCCVLLSVHLAGGLVLYPLSLLTASYRPGSRRWQNWILLSTCFCSRQICLRSV
jgi:glucose-6-phosphate-specific signal transduction histidine kinase